MEINGVPIELVNEFNFLGTTLDEHMSWQSHIQKISSKIACTTGTMTRLKIFLPDHILKLIYNSLILPHLNFAILVWGGNFKQLQKLQIWAIRTITNSKYNSHTDPL